MQLCAQPSPSHPFENYMVGTDNGLYDTIFGAGILLGSILRGGWHDVPVYPSDSRGGIAIG
jgi:hypothetical protein